jgi:hypothetical protein
MGGITTSATGPNAPMTHDQKIAGFSCDAQRRYRMGEPQNVFGTAAAMVVVILELGFVELVAASCLIAPSGDVRYVVTTDGLKGMSVRQRRSIWDCVRDGFFRGRLQTIGLAAVGSCSGVECLKLPH